MSAWDVAVLVVWLITTTGLVIGARRAGRVTTELWVFIGTISIFWIEPLWDWVLLVRYNRDAFLMMPTHWPVMGMAGGLPWNAPLVYGLWFTSPAVAAKKFLAPRGWPTWVTVGTVTVFGMIFECVAELLCFIEPHRYAYTHVLPHLAYAEGQPNQYPLDVPLWVGLYVAACCLIVLRGYHTEQAAGAIASEPVDQVVTVGAGNRNVPDSSAAPDAAAARQPHLQAQQQDDFLSSIQGMRALGGSRDGWLANLATSIVVFNVVYLATMLPALITRLLGWREIVGNATPFGHAPWPGLPG
jgi:hypothetical protein